MKFFKLLSGYIRVERKTVSFKIKATALYIISFAEIEYHQNEVLHIIIAKVIQPTVDDIHLR